MVDVRRALPHALALGLLGPIAGCKDEPSPPPESETTTTDTGDPAMPTSVADGTGSTDAGMEDPLAPTWHQDVAPVVIARCAGCHREGGIAPFSVSDYEAAAPWATILADAVESGTMPPFAADDSDECQMQYGWRDDLRLSDDERLMLRAWADAGAPEGDPDAAAPVDEPPSVALTEVDTHLAMSGSVTIGGSQDRFMCFSLDPELSEDAYLQALQITPGNEEIVHHVLVFVDADGSTADQAGPDGSYPCSGGSLQGDLVGAWAPGTLPTRTPPEAGMLVPAGARLVMNVHYHPTGVGDEIDDSTGIDLDWMDERPPWVAQLALFGNGQGLLSGPNDPGGSPQFVIPPGVEDHTEAMLLTLPGGIPEVRLWEIGAHMHYLGVEMIIGVRRNGSAGPDEECLLHATHYSFEWQRLYVYDTEFEDSPRIAGGDELYMRCTYDNTLGNPGVVEALGQQGLDAPVEVRLGEETLDEMCLGIYGIAFPNVF